MNNNYKLSKMGTFEKTLKNPNSTYRKYDYQT